MNKNLATIVSEVSKIEMALLESDGEITPEIESMLQVKDIELPSKIDGYALALGRLASMAELYLEKAEEFKRIAKSMENSADRLKENMKLAVEQLGVEVLAGNDFKFSKRKSPLSCTVESESAIPGKYIITETITKVDRKKIIEDVKDGQSVPPGVSVNQGFWLRISPA